MPKELVSTFMTWEDFVFEYVETYKNKAEMDECLKSGKIKQDGEVQLRLHFKPWYYEKYRIIITYDNGEIQTSQWFYTDEGNNFVFDKHLEIYIDNYIEFEYLQFKIYKSEFDLITDIKVEFKENGSR